MSAETYEHLLRRARNSVRLGLHLRAYDEYVAPHRDEMHDADWWACAEPACRPAWSAWSARRIPSDDDLRAFARSASDADLLAMRNVGKVVLRAIRAWSAQGEAVPNWVGEAVPT